MIVESWLNERTDNVHRGRVFAIYSMVNLAATTIGQMLVTIADSDGFVLFTIAAIFYALALVPTAVSKATAPKPLVETGLDLKILWKNSPIALVAAFLIGISNSTFGTLGAVFGEQIQLDVTTIALMMSLSILAGAAFQIPVGYLSDKTDRRIVLVVIMILASVLDLFFILYQPTSSTVILVCISIFGAAIYTAYPVIIAHASDHAKGGSFIKISGGLLLMYGVGGIVGPLVAGGLMASMPQSGLFIVTLAAHLGIILYGTWRIFHNKAVLGKDKSDFVGMTPGRYSTPESSTLDPRSNDSKVRDWGDRLYVADDD
jgi:MFS family permease